MSKSTTLASPALTNAELSALYKAFGAITKQRQAARITAAANAPGIPLALLTSWATDEQWRVRRSVATYTGQIAHNTKQRVAYIALLHTLVEDENWRVSLEAIDALRKFQATESLGFLQHLSTDRKVTPSQGRALHFTTLVLLQDGNSVASQLHILRYAGHNQLELVDKSIEKLCALWREDHTQFEPSTEHPGTTEESLKRARELPFQPLPEWLHGTEEKRMLPTLCRLTHAGAISHYNLLQILLWYVQEEGFSELAAYELMEADKLSQYYRSFILNALKPFDEEIATFLTGHFNDFGSLQHTATLWLGFFGAHAKQALPLLFHAMLEGKKVEQGILRSTIYNIVQHEDSSLSEAELFTYLRTLLYNKIDRNTWRMLALFLETCANHESIDIAIDYIDLHLPEGARQQQSQYRGWVRSLATDTPSPFLRLLRQLVLSPATKNRTLTGPLLCRMLSCPYLSKLTQLDLQDVPLDQKIVHGLKGVTAPPEITHLYLTGTQLQDDLASTLLTYLKLPKLTHLYMANNGPGYYKDLDQHPALSQLEMFNLKNSLHPKTCMALLSSPLLGKIKKINISDNGLSDEHIRALLTAGALSKDSLIDASKNLVEEPAELFNIAIDKGIRLLLR